MIYLKLIGTYLLIGLFGFGGGYAMLALIERMIVGPGWITEQTFTDIVAISQMTPGPIGINSATYVGYAAVVGEGYAPWMGILGSVVATIAVVLPSFLLMIAVIRIFHRFHDHPVVKSMLELFRSTLVGLIAAAALLLMTAENFGTPTESPWQFGVSLFIFIFTLIGTQWMKIHPIRMIIYCAIAGLMLYY